MYANGKSCQIGYQDEPTVAVRFVGHLFPLQYQPEYHGCEQRREGIYLTLYSREPEGVAEGVGQCAYQSASHDGNQLAACDARLVLYHQFAYQVCDAPEQKQDTGSAHQRTHVVHHFGHGGGV